MGPTIKQYIICSDKDFDRPVNYTDFEDCETECTLPQSEHQVAADKAPSRKLEGSNVNAVEGNTETETPGDAGISCTSSSMTSEEIQLEKKKRGESEEEEQ